MTPSKYSFIRTELRVLQNTCEGDNEAFLNALADMFGQREEQIEKLKKQISDDSWGTNPDRMGGCYSEDELKESGWK